MSVSFPKDPKVGISNDMTNTVHYSYITRYLSISLSLSIENCVTDPDNPNDNLDNFPVLTWYANEVLRPVLLDGPEASLYKWIPPVRWPRKP